MENFRRQQKFKSKYSNKTSEMFQDKQTQKRKS